MGQDGLLDLPTQGSHSGKLNSQLKSYVLSQNPQGLHKDEVGIQVPVY